MIKYVAHRLMMMIGILFGVLVITFVVSHVLPSSPVEMMLGAKPTPEQIAAARVELGLNQPLYVQFFRYIIHAVTGDLGVSLRTHQPVASDMLVRLGATFELVTLGMILAVLIGTPLGVMSAVRQDTGTDHATRSVAIAGVALPPFFTGMLLQLLFYGILGWLPLQGRIGSEMLLDHPFPNVTGVYLVDTLLDGNWTAFISALSHIALPVFTLTIFSLAVVARISRNMMVEVLSQDYIRTARAYGLPLRSIHYRYALRATLIPLLTVVGLTYGYMLGSSVIVEYVFDWPGLGSYIVNAIISNDFPAVMGVTLFFATSYLMVNLIVDLLYFAVDPRLRKT